MNFKKIQRTVKTILSQEYATAAIYYIVANIIGQGIVLLSSAIFTRMMSKTDYGLVSTYSAWVLILNTFICLNLFVSARNAYIDFPDDYDRFNSSVLFLSILIGISITLVLLCFSIIFKFKAGKGEILLACMQAIALNIINYKLAIQSMKNEYKQRALLLIAPNWTHTLLSIILMFVFASNLYISKITGNMLGLLIFGTISAVGLFRISAPAIILRYWKYALILSIPLIFHTLADLILIQSDRLMLTTLVGADITAEYSIIYNVGYIVVTICIAINGAWLPFFFNKLSENKIEDIKKAQVGYILFFTLLTCGILTVSPELVKIISPQSYWKGLGYANLIILASYIIFMYTLFTNYLTYMKKVKSIARNTFLAATLNILLNYYLIPRYYSVGAAISTIISYFILFSLHFYSLGKEGRQYFSFSAIIINLLIVLTYGILFFVVYKMILIRYFLFLFIFFAFYFFNDRKKIIYFTE